MAANSNDILATLSSYVSAVKLGLTALDVCDTATVAQLDIGTVSSSSSSSFIDGVKLVEGQRILIKNQSNETENGVYKVENLLLRKVDMRKLSFPGALSVQLGLQNAGRVFVLSLTTSEVLTVMDLSDYVASIASTPTANDSHTTQCVSVGPGGAPAMLLPGNLGTAGSLFVSGTTKLNELVVQGSLTFDGSGELAEVAEDMPRLNVKNGTLNNCQKNGLILKLYSLANSLSYEDVSSSRNVLTTVARSIAYNKLSWNVGGETYDRNMFVTFTGYIRPQYVESALLYLTVAGLAHLWIDGDKLAEINTREGGQRVTHTVSYEFKSLEYVPFILHYLAPASSADSALVIEWSFLSAPIKTIVDSSYFAYSGNESGSTLLGPVDAYGPGQFHSDVQFERDTVTQGNVTVGGAIICDEFNTRDGVNGFRFVQDQDTNRVELLGNELRLNPAQNQESALSIVSSDGFTSTLGVQTMETGANITNPRIENHMTLATSVKLPFTIKVGTGNVLTLRDSSMSVPVPIVANSGVNITSGDLVVSGDIITNGQIYQSGKVAVGAARESSSIYPEKFSIVGDSGSLTNGPQFATYTSLDSKPLFQLSSFSHDNVSLNFDASYDGATLTPSAAYAAQISKTARQLSINRFSPTGSNWIPAWSIDLLDGTGLFSGKTTVFAHDDTHGFGSLRLAPATTGAGTSIAFYNTTNLRAALTTDFFRLGYLGDTFSLRNGANESLLMVTPSGDMKVGGNLTASAAQFNESVSIAGQLRVATTCNVGTLIISSVADQSSSENHVVALDVKGSGHVAKDMSIGGRLLAGRLHISSSLPRLVFDTPNPVKNQDGPKLGSTSRGTRILIAKARLSKLTDTAIGTGTGDTLWHAVPSSSSAHEWYAGENLIMSLSGHGDLVINGEGGNDSTVAFQNINTVSINGENANGSVNFGGNWSIRGTKDTFLITETGSGSCSDSSLELPVLQVIRDGVTGRMSVTMPVADTLQIDHGVVLAKEAAFVGKVTTASLYLTDPSGASEISFDDCFKLTSNSANSVSSIWSERELTIRSDVGMVINRGSKSPFDICYGDDSIWRLDASGCVINSSVLVKNGDLLVENGAFSVCNANIVSTFAGQVHAKNGLQLEGDQGLTFTTSNENVATVGYAQNSSRPRSSVPFVMRTPGDLILRGNTGIKLDPGKGEVRVNGTIRVKNTALTDKGLLLTSSILTASSSYTIETILAANDHWYYVGQLNTTPNGTAPDERGRLCVTLTDCTGELSAWATVVDGGVQVNHSKVDAVSGGFASRLEFFKGNTGIYVFVKTSCASHGTSLCIRASTMARAPQCTDEGFGGEPDGVESSYNASFSSIWNSNDADASTSSSLDTGVKYGQGVFSNELVSHGSLIVHKESRFKSGLYTENIYPADDTGSLTICGLTLSNKQAKVATTLSAAKSDVSIGTCESPFYNGLFSGVVVTQSLEACELHISKTAKIVGDLSIGSALSVTNAASQFLQIDVTGELTVGGLFTSNNIASQVIACKTFTVEHALAVHGPLQLVGNATSLKPINDTNTLQVNAEDIYLQAGTAGNSALRMGADGSIRGSGGLAISCGSGETILLGHKACQSVQIIGDVLVVDGRLESKGQVSIDSTLVVAGESVFHSTVEIQPTVGASSLLLGCSATGSGGIAVNNQDHYNLPLLQWEVEDQVRLQVPGCSSSTALTLNAHGDLLCVGNVSSALGTGTFKDIVSERVTSSTIDVFGAMLLGSSPNRHELGIVENGDFALISPLGSTLVISRESACATFAGELVSKGPVSVPSIRIGSSVQILHDGRLTFADGSNPAEVKLISATGARPSAFTFSNSGGDLVFHAAKERGFAIAAVSGNATFQGQLAIESGLDVDTSVTSDIPTAALLIKGGVLVRRSVLIEGTLQLANTAGDRFAITAPHSGGTAGGYTLSLPRTLPSSPGQCLVSNANGQLSWKPYGNPTEQSMLLASRSLPVSSDCHTYSADNNITDDIVTGFQVAGSSFHINHFVVTVTRADGLQNMVVAYELRGVRVADDWIAEIRRTVGDGSIPITFHLLPDGRLTYSANPIQSWTSTTFKWSSNVIAGRDELTSRSLLGQDTVISSLNENAGTFLAIKSSVCTRSVDAGRGEAWSSVHFAQTKLLDDAPSQITDTASAATVTIEDAPEWNVTSRDKYALRVCKGESRFGGIITADEGISAAKLTVKGSMNVDGSLSLGGGTEVKALQKGILHIGPNSSKSATMDIVFQVPMSDTAYCMMGNAVSADPNTPDAFACTFKNLTRAGCKVTVCNIMAESWTDVTLRVHWFAIL